MKMFPPVTLLLLLMGLAPSTAQAQQTLNYTACVAQLDQMVAEVEGAAQSGFFGLTFTPTVPIDAIRPPQFQAQQGILDYRYETGVTAGLLLSDDESQSEMVPQVWEFAIVRSGGAFSCAFRRGSIVAGEWTTAYEYSLPLSSVSEINRWHAAYVRTTRHLERLLVP